MKIVFYLSHPDIINMWESKEMINKSFLVLCTKHPPQMRWVSYVSILIVETSGMKYPNHIQGLWVNFLNNQV